jgi:hypothetical protein
MKLTNQENPTFLETLASFIESNRCSDRSGQTDGGEGNLRSCRITLTTPAPWPSKPRPAGPKVHKMVVSCGRNEDAVTCVGVKLRR